MIDKLNEFLEKGADQFYDDNYDIEIRIHRHQGDKGTNVEIEGDEPSILTGSCMLLETLLREGVADEDLLHDMVERVIKAVRSCEK